MFNKKLIAILPIVIICLIAVSAVSAGENNTADIAGIDENQVTLHESSNEVIGQDNNELSTRPDNFTSLNTAINGNNDSLIDLNHNYTYDSNVDGSFRQGITINRSVTIDGHGSTISGDGRARIFNVVEGHSVVFKQINFIMGSAGNGGAVIGGTFINCTFKDNMAINGNGSAIYKGKAVNCTFTSNIASGYGGAVAESDCFNCTFTGNAAPYGGAGYGGNYYDCTFISNEAHESGGGLYSPAVAVNCTFRNNAANDESAAIYGGVAVFCTFINNACLETDIHDTAALKADNLSFDCYCDEEFSFKVMAGNTEIHNIKSALELYRLTNNGNEEYMDTYYRITPQSLVVNLPPGSYRLRLSAVDYPQVSETSVYLNVSRIPTVISLNLNNVTIFYGNDTYLIAGLKDCNNNTIRDFKMTVDLNGIKTYHADGETIKVPLNNLPVGTYTADIRYGGNESLNESAACATICVVKVPTSILPDISSYETTYSLNDSVNVTVVDYYGNPIRYVNVNVTLNGTKDYTTDENGTIRIPTFGLMPDDYIINVTFENEIYEKSNKTYNLKINKRTTQLIGELNRPYTAEITNKNDLTVTLEYYDGNNQCYLPVANVNVSVVLKGFNKTYLTDVNGQINVSTDGFAADNYTANVTFSGNEIYEKTNLSAKVIINRDIPHVYSNEIHTRYNLDDVLIIYLTDSNNNPIKGYYNVTVDLDGEKEYTTDENATIRMPLKNIHPENYIATLRFDGNENYTNVTNYAKVYIKREITELSSQNITTFYNSGENLTVTLKDSLQRPLCGLKLSVNLNGIENYTTDENGTVKIPAKGLGTGNHSVSITFAGNRDYENSTVNATLSVIKADTAVYVKTKITGNVVNITADVNPDATGLVKFSIAGYDEYNLFSEIVNGRANVFYVLGEGNYTVNVTYIGDEHFNSNSTSENFTVFNHIKLNTTLTADAFVDGYAVTVTVNVDSRASGFVEMVIAGKKYYSPVENGKANFTSYFLAGTYMGNICYLGDDNFNEARSLVYFNVADENATLLNTTLDVGISTSGYNVFVTAEVNVSATGLVSISVGDNVVYLPVKNGKASYEVVLPGGEYNVTVTYLGDAKFNPNSTTRSFAVYDHIKLNTTIACGVVADNGEVTITVNLNENATGFVEFKINDNLSYLPVKEGEIVFKGIFNPGYYNVTATYLGNDDFNANSTVIAFAVNKIGTQILASDVSTTYGNNKNIVLTLTDVKGNLLIGKKVTVRFNNKVYAGTVNDKGQVSIAIGQTLVPKTYVASITFDEDEIYLKSTATVNVAVAKATPKMTAKAKTFKYKVKTKKYAIILKVNGKALKKVKVTLKVKGKTFAAKTNSNGKATFKITKFTKKGKYNASITYKGNKYYNKVAKKVKIKIR